ncbi:hypothetical protein BGZ65_009179, partial [Modicella reniformis]
KNPEAKGGPGCSYRLFLIAFIIAAKYRRRVELPRPMQQDGDRVGQEGGGHDNEYRRPRRSMDKNDCNGEFASVAGIDGHSPSNYAPSSEKNADLVFSNKAWVHLLNRGLPLRQPATTSSASESAVRPPSPLVQLPSLSSIINSGSSPAATVLQVEDLDRMEAEFLKFLNYDLETLNHDLQTCWNLVAGDSVSGRSPYQPSAH